MLPQSLLSLLWVFFCLLPTRISKQLRLPGWVAKRDIFHSSSGEEVVPYIRSRHSKWLDMVPCVRTRHSPWLDMVPCIRAKHSPWLNMVPHPLQALQSLCLICSNLPFISITSSQDGCDEVTGSGLVGIWNQWRLGGGATFAISLVFINLH